MVNRFEDITYELTSSEAALLPRMVGALARSDKNNMYNSARLIQLCDLRIADGPRIRKMIHEIRVKDLLPNGLALVSTSQGYYATRDPEEIREYIVSLKQRISAIAEIVTAMKRTPDIYQTPLFTEEPNERN